MYEQLEQLCRRRGEQERARVYAARAQAHLEDAAVIDLQEDSSDDDRR
jgi:hypothetical protein